MSDELKSFNIHGCRVKAKDEESAKKIADKILAKHGLPGFGGFISGGNGKIGFTTTNKDESEV